MVWGTTHELAQPSGERGGDHVGDHGGEGDDLPGQLGGLSPVSRLLHSSSGLSHPNKTKLQI